MGAPSVSPETNEATRVLIRIKGGGLDLMMGAGLMNGKGFSGSKGGQANTTLKHANSFDRAGGDVRIRCRDKARGERARLVKKFDNFSFVVNDTINPVAKRGAPHVGNAATTGSNPL